MISKKTIQQQLEEITKNMSDYEVARVSGIPRTTWRSAKNGSDIGLKKAEQLAKSLNMQLVLIKK